MKPAPPPWARRRVGKKPNGRTRTIAGQLARLRAAGKPLPTVRELAGLNAISEAAVRRHLEMLGETLP